MSVEVLNKPIFNYDKWEKKFEELTEQYKSASPYPHIALDDFLEVQAADKALASFPAIQDEGWIHYVHVNEKKHGLNKADLLPEYIKEVIAELNSDRFVKQLSKLTGIDNLMADDMLEGGGLHQTRRGGFLNIHADFTVHPHKRNLKRRVNLIVYLNKNWGDDYGGELELWDRGMKQCEEKIAPLFNRAVMFNTDDDSYHGLPDPLTCPEGETRKSIALYYFTEEKETPKLRTTNYRARPSDGLKSILIYLDKKMVSVYTTIKRTFGLNDDFVSKVLNVFSSKPKK